MIGIGRRNGGSGKEDDEWSSGSAWAIFFNISAAIHNAYKSPSHLLFGL